MRVLAAMETSGRIRDAFAARGHYAVTLDILPARHDGPHIQADVMEALDWDLGWDLAIFHPVCTKLTVAAAWTLYHPEDKDLPVSERRPHPKYPRRREEQAEQVEWVRRLWDKATACIPRVVFKNPVGALSTQWRKPTQTIQPYDFGDDASKRTCLWLQGVELLKPTERFPPRLAWDAKLGRMAERWSNQTDRGMNRLGPSADRWQVRSDTFPGVAKAMAEQWSPT